MSRYSQGVEAQSSEVPEWFTCAESYVCIVALHKGLGVCSPTCCVVMLSSTLHVSDLCVSQDSSELRKYSSFHSFHCFCYSTYWPQGLNSILSHTLQSGCQWFPTPRKYLIHGCLFTKSFDIFILVDHSHLRKNPTLPLLFFSWWVQYRAMVESSSATVGQGSNPSVATYQWSNFREVGQLL